MLWFFQRDHPHAQAVPILDLRLREKPQPHSCGFFYASTISTDKDTGMSSTLGGLDYDNDALDFRLVVQAAKGELVITNALTAPLPIVPISMKIVATVFTSWSTMQCWMKISNRFLSISHSSMTHRRTRNLRHCETRHSEIALTGMGLGKSIGNNVTVSLA